MLRLGKVMAIAPNPPAGTIEHDSTGAATGVLAESAQPLVTALIPQPTNAQWRQGILKMIEKATP